MYSNENSTYLWTWVHSNFNCITRLMLSRIAVARIDHSEWFDGYAVFSPTPPPLANLHPSTSTIGDT